jgi:hypothetical protein
VRPFGDQSARDDLPRHFGGVRAEPQFAFGKLTRGVIGRGDLKLTIDRICLPRRALQPSQRGERELNLGLTEQCRCLGFQLLRQFCRALPPRLQ